MLTFIVLSNCCIKSKHPKLHHTDTRATSPSPTLKILSAKWGATSTIFNDMYVAA